MTSHQFLAEWSQWFWPIVANHLLQTTLFVLVLWIAVKLFKQAPAQFRYFLWLSALAKFLVPSALLVWLMSQAGFDLSLPFEAAQSATRAAASGIATAYTEVRIIFQIAQPLSPAEQMAPTVAAIANQHTEIYCALTIVWLLGAMTLTARWLIRRWRFARALRSGRIIISGREFDALKRAQSWLFVNQEISLVISSQVCEPGVWRVRHPVVVLPEGVSSRLSDEEIEAVMMHELVHVLHRDNLIGSLQMIVCNLLWFHPLAWLIDRQLLAEREMRCDETVIRLGAEPKLYATSLWKVAQFGLGWPVAGVSRAAGANLKRRLERMLTSNNQFETTIARRAATYASFFVLALLAVTVSLFGGDSALAQRNKIEATTKKAVAEGPKGGVKGGVPGGVEGGIPGGVKDSARAVTQFSNLTTATTQEPGSLAKDNRKRRSSPLDQALYEAAENGDIADINELLNAGANVNCAVDGDGSPLIGAARKGRLAAVRLLLDRGADPNMSVPGDGNPLIMAAREGHKDVVSLLLDRGANINLTVHGDENALIQASGEGHDSLVRFLIERGADVNARAWAERAFGPPGGEWRTPLSMARKRGHERVVSILLAAGAQEDGSTNSIHQMDSSMRPTILYKEKAEYTQEARDNNIEGTVTLSVVFGDDGQINGIRVIRGLAHGLTQKAIEVAKKIRFAPAVKDGQPVSVRGMLEYSFKLGK